MDNIRRHEMEGEEKKEAAAPSPRTINANAPCTFIEHQYITVQAGANFYNGSKPEEPRQGDGRKVPVCSFQQKTDTIKHVLNTMVKDDEIVKKQDFGIIKHLINEMKIFDKFTNDDMMGILAEIDMPDSIRPSLSALKVYSFGNQPLPNWKIMGADMMETKRIIALGESFRDAYNTFV